MQASLTSRPRPVSATVTKLSWKQTSSQAAVRKIRSKSLESNGSTASLTSLLDHDSYNSASDIEVDVSDKIFNTTYSHSEVETSEQHQENGIRDSGNMSPREKQLKSKSADSSLSAWEFWIIEKAKSERQRKHKERLKKKKEKADKEKQEQEKRARILKAEITRSLWLQKKNEEMHIQKRMEKLRIEEEKRKKKELDEEVKKRAAEKFEKWQELKKEETKERIKKNMEEKKEKKQQEMQRKVAAEEKFKEWLKMAHHKPKSASNSFGYISGKMTGYHDRNAYPQPSFYNPIPWQPPAIPSSKPIEKKNKVKAYKWNPEKYL